MTLSLTQSATAVGPLGVASFLGINGTEPYLYDVLGGGAGGVIDAASGAYTAPESASSDPQRMYATVQVTDYLGATATAQILVGTPLMLFCEIIQRELELAAGRVYLWDQKLFQPTDAGLYVAVSVPSCRPFANVNRFDPAGDQAAQSVNMQATLDLDIISRSSEARDRKEEVILALNSDYARFQQDACAFLIAKLPPMGGFINLSEVDGAAIPYRYRITVRMQYVFTKRPLTAYYENFSPPGVATDA